MAWRLSYLQKEQVVRECRWRQNDNSSDAVECSEALKHRALMCACLGLSLRLTVPYVCVSVFVLTCVSVCVPVCFSPDLLGSRLEADGELQPQACLCYICAGNVEKLVSCWARAQESHSPLSLQVSWVTCAPG